MPTLRESRRERSSMRSRLNLLLAALMFLVAGCAGTQFEWATARQIKAGMTENEVIALMGPPYLVKSQGGTITWVWSYADAFSGSKSVSVVFKDGKVSDPPPIPSSFR